ncbi:MAG: HlyD family efflux transporter periplasmic adaptor subunit [Desulfobacteraceae bacterium]|nr:MAG: HlyD family efflux transporter periplasmic adaptor subunit [Desulfobacteraceae bacterium]
MKTLKRLVILVPIIIGVGLFMVMKNSKKLPEREEHMERVQAVRVISLQKTPVVPRTTGYGYVQPDRTWQAIPEVSGQVAYMDKNIKKGQFISKGDLLLKIDTRAYGLAESKGIADVMNLDARLKELEQSKKNTERLLTIEKKSLAIASQELARKRKLFEQQYISASDMEKEETSFLARQTTVNNLENTLKLIPAQEKALKAQKRSGESSVAQKRLDVSKTEIRAPFDGRISEVNVEQSQFAPAGSVLLEAEGIDRAEIPVKLAPHEFFKLLPRHYIKPLSEVPDIDTIRRAIGISARVRLHLDSTRTIQWQGRFSRTGEAMDPATGTLDFFVSVDNPYGNLIPGKQPPLVTNMYVEVELSGRPLDDRYIIPKSAFHQGMIYICNRDNRLEIREVTPEFGMGDILVLSQGVEPGETLVLSDLVPAISGMKLAPMADTDETVRLKIQAAGEI